MVNLSNKLGDGYSSGWVDEANKRGIWNLPQTVDSLKVKLYFNN
jgi:glutamine synthetase type III